MLVTDLHIDRARLAQCCRRYGVARLETFGSFVTGDAGPESDLDVLVIFRPEARINLEFVALQRELEEIMGRRVDLLTRQSVERSPNKYFRRFALTHVEPLYES
jgi:hypothetical protein